MPAALAALVAAAPGSLVLPPGDRRAHVVVPEPLRLLGSRGLGEGRHVAVVEDADGGRWTVPVVVDGDLVRRAAPGDGVAEALVEAIPRLVQEPFTTELWHTEPAQGERGLAVDQTNESVVVGERAMLKWAVHLPRSGVVGAQPAAARIATLAAFPETPQPWGLLGWRDPATGVSAMLASVTAYLPGAQDGWDWAVDDVRRAACHEGLLDDALEGPKRLGALTARMHVALAGEGVRYASEATARAWHERALADLDEAARLVTGEPGARLRALAPRSAVGYDALRDCAGTPLIGVHGDYHVGQVLRSPSDDPALRWEYAVTDFDGNPVLAPEERSAPQPAAFDVAGMLASLDHVGRVVDERVEGADAGIVRTWIAAAQECFRYEYVDTLARLRQRDLLDERLLVPLRLQQEVREHLYAVRHLPHWVYVPDAALADLLPDALME